MKVFENTGGEYGHLLIQDTGFPADFANPEALAAYEALGKKRLHTTTASRTPGLKMLISAWYFEANRDKQLGARDIGEFECHVHETDELIIYYGSDPENPTALNGEIEFILGGESHVINKSTILYIPAGIPHSKPLVNRVDRPIFHMSMELAR